MSRADCPHCGDGMAYPGVDFEFALCTECWRSLGYAESEPKPVKNVEPIPAETWPRVVGGVLYADGKMLAEEQAELDRIAREDPNYGQD